MSERLILTTPQVQPALVDWGVHEFFLCPKTPAIKVTYRSNTGEMIVWRYVVSLTVTLSQVRAACSFINQGKFMTVQGKSLDRWLIDQAQAAGVLSAGIVTGSVD